MTAAHLTRRALSMGRSDVIVVGAGITGLACAWALQDRGHAVLLLDPCFPPAGDDIPNNGSQAALGVLMGHLFHRSGGRGWRLRQQSTALWRLWRRELALRGHAIPWRRGVLQLASTAEELENQRQRAEGRRRQGLPLERWDSGRLAHLRPALPNGVLGGLYSPEDGQIDPNAAMAALSDDAIRRGLSWQAERAVALEPWQAGGRPRWRVRLDGGGTVAGAWVVLTAGLASAELLRPLGHDWPLEPVLGQAIELERAIEHEAMPAPEGAPGPEAAWNWPGVVVWRGINLIPRPDRPGGRRLWVGATLEPGRHADPEALLRLADLDGSAPPWLRLASSIRSWQGIRPRPVGRPAPLHEPVAPGLLLASGHYRNGVLLAPATAAWVLRHIEACAKPD